MNIEGLLTAGSGLIVWALAMVVERCILLTDRGPEFRGQLKL